MARRLTKNARARRYLQASMEAGYTNLPAEQREAKQSLMREHERKYAGVRRHALAGTRRHFDEPLTAGEREHQTHLRRSEGLQERDILQIQRDLDRKQEKHTGRRRAQLAGPRTAATAASAAGGAIGDVVGGGGNTFLYFIGVALMLILVYLLVAGKGANAITGIVGAITGAVRTFVSPADPILSLEHALRANPTSRASRSSSSAAASTSGGGSSALAGVTGSTQAAGYVRPFTGATPERIDMGQDFALKPGAPIRAIGPGKVTAIIPDWSAGQPLIAYELTAGSAKGRTIYVAEQITPRVHVGDTLRAGQVIGTYASSGTGIETGWAEPSGKTLAQATTGYTEGQATPAGKSFSSFLGVLGVPVG